MGGGGVWAILFSYFSQLFHLHKNKEHQSSTVIGSVVISIFTKKTKGSTVTGSDMELFW